MPGTQYDKLMVISGVPSLPPLLHLFVGKSVGCFVGFVDGIFDGYLLGVVVDIILGTMVGLFGNSSSTSKKSRI